MSDEFYGFDDPDFDETDEDEEWEFDCGMDRDGLCGKAGSEECDFECPFRDEMYRKLDRRKTGA